MCAEGVHLVWDVQKPLLRHMFRCCLERQAIWFPKVGFPFLSSSSGSLRAHWVSG
jgi:hypothetical protein